VPGRLDRSLDELIRYQLRGHQPGHPREPAQIAILLAIVAGAAAALQRWSGVLLAIVGTIAAAAITEVILKPLIGRLRSGALPFPSGHPPPWPQWPSRPRFSSGSAEWPRSAALRLLGGVVLVAIPVGGGLSLVAQHVHYLTNTVAGYCMAVATVLAVALGLDLLVRCPPPLGTAAWPDSRRTRPLGRRQSLARLEHPGGWAKMSNSALQLMKRSTLCAMNIAMHNA
jgi:membrane-associated phospholipid phosphatase